MPFSDFIVRQSIITNLQATTKEGVIRELVESLAQSGVFPQEQVDEVVNAVLKREELGTTGIGNGIATPHARVSAVKDFYGTIGISVDGVDFDSLDCQRARIFILLISPNKTGTENSHLEILKYISLQTRNKEFCRFLLQSHDRETILELLDEADRGVYSAQQ